MIDDNQKITKKELDQIRSLTDFDLTMVLSEIHDHGWPTARATLVLAWDSSEKEQGRPGLKKDDLDREYREKMILAGWRKEGHGKSSSAKH